MALTSAFLFLRYSSSVELHYPESGTVPEKEKSWGWETSVRHTAEADHDLCDQDSARWQRQL